MIKTVKDRSEIKELWQEAFGATDKETMFFADNVKDADSIGIYKNGELASTMYLVECTLDGEKYFYIYAACTLKKYRKEGLMTNLLEYAVKNYKNVCLIPANEGLADYYRKRGFTDTRELTSIRLNQTKEIIEYLFEGCDLKEPFILVYKGE